MEQGEHRVGLASAEARLKLDDRVPSGAADPLQGSGQEETESLREMGPLEELAGLPVLVGALSPVDLSEVGGELRLLKVS